MKADHPEDIEDIKELIAQTENEQVEFKETTGQLERGMETLCAFLNGEGGTVLFGITDKGKIIGQEVADVTKRSIAEAINRLEPTANVHVFYIPLPDSSKKIIALHVENSRDNRPFCYKSRPYYRVESVTSAMPQAVTEAARPRPDGAGRALQLQVHHPRRWADPLSSPPPQCENNFLVQADVRCPGLHFCFIGMERFFFSNNF